MGEVASTKVLFARERVEEELQRMQRHNNSRRANMSQYLSNQKWTDRQTDRQRLGGKYSTLHLNHELLLPTPVRRGNNTLLLYSLAIICRDKTIVKYVL